MKLKSPPPAPELSLDGFNFSQFREYVLEVFRLGTHTDADGQTDTFYDDMVDEAIENYDPQYFRAPLIISHETLGIDDRQLPDSELSYGIVDRFKREGDRIYAVFKKISGRFIEFVNDGQIHSISVSLYPPKSKQNPYPGKWAFRHVAGLGKSPPAVKGMAPITLSECDQEFVDFAAQPIAIEEVSMADTLRQIFRQELEKLGVTTVQKPITDGGDMQTNATFQQGAQTETEEPVTVEQPTATAATQPETGAVSERLGAIETTLQQFSEVIKKLTAPAAVAATAPVAQEVPAIPAVQFQQHQDKQEEEIEELRAALVTIQLERREEQIANFVESYKDRLTPGLLGASVSFSEGGAEKTINFNQFLGSLNPVQLEFVRGILDSMPSVRDTLRSETVPSGEMSFGGMGASRSSGIGAKELARRAKARRQDALQKGIQMSEREAIDAVLAEVNSGSAAA